MDSLEKHDHSTAERLLQSAMIIIGESGLKGLSASKLAEMAKVSKSTVFHHFKKMDDIPALILKKLYEVIFIPVEEGAYTSSSDFLKALGKATFTIKPEHLVLYRAFLSLFQASMQQETLKQIVMECSEGFDAFLFEKLVSLSPHADHRTLKRLSRMLSMSLDGIALHYLIKMQLQEAAEAWETLVDATVMSYQL